MNKSVEWKTTHDRLKAGAFWHSHLLSCVENYMEMHKDDPEIFYLPETVTFDWCLQLLVDHLDCTDEMWSAQETYEQDFGEVEESLFEDSLRHFLDSFPQNKPKEKIACKKPT